MFSQEDKDNFFEAVDSLKKYRRAELSTENGKSLIDKLYTDLLPNEQVLKTCLKDNTTFLIGRKGTGKSTIFLKLQQELRKRKTHITCYIDAKTIFETSKTEYISLEHLKELIPQDILQNYLVERTFVQNILIEIKKELNKKTEGLISKVKNILNLGKIEQVKQKIESLSKKIEDNKALSDIEIPIIKEVFKNEIRKNSEQIETALYTETSVETDMYKGKIKSNIGGNLKENESVGVEVDSKFSEIFLKVFQINSIIVEIKEILEILEIKNLVILLDDFSEIDDLSMKTFVDSLLAPLNNWSDEFIKFKVAAYPSRIYFGKIDQGKIDMLDLDFYNLYSEFSRDTMEERAVDFTKRIIETRLSYFTNKNPDYFFNTNTKETMSYYYDLIFKISMNVPRIIGYILFYCYQSTILFGKKINRQALESASKTYYLKIIEPFFEKTTYSMMAYEEKISVLQLKELLNIFVEEFKNNKKRILNNEVLSGDKYDTFRKNPFVSHFYVTPSYEDLLSTLELNFFINKYTEMSSRDGEKSSIYCLNYGLCIEENLRWGKPNGTDYRKYFIERIFDFNKQVDIFLNESKEIICSVCERKFSAKELKFLEFNNMKCPCGGLVQIKSISKNIAEKIERIEKTKLLSQYEYSILYELNKTDIPMKAKEIAEELDTSHQLIGKRVKKLDEEKGLVERVGEKGKRVYKLTRKAKEDYFSNIQR